MRNTVGRALLAFLFFQFCSTIPVFAQSKGDTTQSSSVYVIPPVKEILDISKSGYYLDEVLDVRGNKINNGNIIQKNIKSSLVFADSLPLYVYSFISPKVVSEDGYSRPVSVQIEKFRCFSSTNGNIDEGQIYVKISFYEKKQNGQKLVHSFERTMNYQKKSKPDFVAKIIYNAFHTAFAGLRNLAPRVTAANTLATKRYQREDSINGSHPVPVNTYVIPLPNRKSVWNHPNYYLSGVEDIRDYTKNEGSVMTGFFNRRSQAKLDSTLVYYLQNAISSTAETGKKPLKLYVRTFKCSEEFTPQGVQGTLFFSANLVLDSAGSRYTIYKNVVTIDSLNENDITKLWPGIISKAMDTYFGGFSPNLAKPFKTENQKLASDEIVVEGFYYKKKYFWRETELRKLRDFQLAFDPSPSIKAKQDFKTAKALIITGRAVMASGGVFVAYAMADFLAMNDQSIKDWYRASPSESESFMIANKRLFLWGGGTMIVAGFVCNALGKNFLSKAIRGHNRAVMERMSFNVSPDIRNRGCLFQLNMQLGHSRLITSNIRH